MQYSSGRNQWEEFGEGGLDRDCNNLLADAEAVLCSFAAALADGSSGWEAGLLIAISTEEVLGTS